MNSLRRIVLMPLLTAWIIAGGVALTWLLNPYGATGSTLIDPIFRKIKQERLATPYMIRTARPETLLLGSSRVLMGIRIEQGARDGTMNAAIKGATLSQIARIVDVALRNPRLKRIVWGVDFFAFSSRWNADDPNFNARIADRPQARVEDTLLSFDAAGDGLDMLKRAWRGRARLSPMTRADVPWSTEFICAQYSADRVDGLDTARPEQIAMQLEQIMYLYGRYQYSRAQLELFRATVDRIRERGVELILFVPPMSEYELELIRQSGHWNDFETFKRKLAAAAPYWDFAAYNAMAPRDEFYLQVIHFKPAPGHEILRLLLGADPPDCNEDARAVSRSGTRVDAGTVENVLAMQRRMRDEAASRDSRYARMAAEAIRAAGMTGFRLPSSEAGAALE